LVRYFPVLHIQTTQQTTLSGSAGASRRSSYTFNMYMYSAELERFTMAGRRIYPRLKVTRGLHKLNGLTFYFGVIVKSKKSCFMVHRVIDRVSAS